MASDLTHPCATLVAVVWLASCASVPPAPPHPTTEPSAATGAPVFVGMGAAGLREAWGPPTSIRKTPSPAVPGLVYERWSFGTGGEGREALLVDDRVVDFYDPAEAGDTGGRGASLPAPRPAAAPGAAPGEHGTVPP